MTIETLPGRLAREISRVTAIREHYVSLLGWSGVEVRPAIMMIEMALRRALEAAGSPDVEGQIAALRDLEGFDQ